MTAAIATVNVSEMVRDIKDSMNLHDPREIADEISSRLSDEEKLVIFEALLPQRVREVLGVQRTATFDNDLPDEVSSTTNTAKPNLKNSKAARARKWFPEFIKRSVFTEKGWIALGDCTVKDLEFISESRTKQAQTLLDAAAEFNSLRDLLVKFDVETVSELDEADIKAAGIK
ncbi:hypothetical protein PBI_PEREGRIN_186 [Rhodococcus phage Peregrin]|nr:hypothetical protein PBI_PEREGRIN_186 [Rhodococcus phage Peregrin]